mgnify:CR=1 FL=1
MILFEDWPIKLLAGLFFYSFLSGEQTMIVVFVDTPLIELASLSSLMIGRECG